MRAWPRSMTAQLLALLLLGLVAAHLIGLVLVQPNGTRIHVISRDQMAEHAAVAWRLAQLPAAQAQEALARASDGDTRYRLDPDPQIDAAHEEGGDQDLLRQRLQAQLGLPPEALRISLREADDGPALLRIALRTPAGLWVNTQQQPLITQGWVRPLRFSVPVSTLPVLLIVALFLRRILRPVKALAQAAERVSRGEEVAPLPLTGPQEAREVTAAFNLMQQRLRRFVEDRTRMLAAISHDLRTPITSLRLRAELVDDAALRTAMIRTLDEMRVMVEETVRFARDDAHAEATREIDLAELLQELAQEHASQGRDVQITVQKNAQQKVQNNVLHETLARQDAPLRYRCRPVHLKRALSNLVDNAVRHGQRARLSLIVEHDGSLSILVDDDGPGIAEEHLQEVFKPFVRLDPARSGGNFGLGLAIARSCIEAHGGRLELRNRRQPGDQGLQACISLPA